MNGTGNVRQLQNVLRNIVVLNNGKEITLDMLPPPLNQPVVRQSASKFIEPDILTVSDIMPLWMTEKMVPSSRRFKRVMAIFHALRAT